MDQDQDQDQEPYARGARAEARSMLFERLRRGLRADGIGADDADDAAIWSVVDLVLPA